MKKHKMVLRVAALAAALVLPMSAMAADGGYMANNSSNWNYNLDPQLIQTQNSFLLGYYTLTHTQLVRLGFEKLNQVGGDGYRRYSNLFDLAYQNSRYALGYQFMNSGVSLQRHTFWGIGGGVHASFNPTQKYIVNSTKKNTPFNISGYVQLGIGGVLHLFPNPDYLTIPYIGVKGIVGFGTADGSSVYEQSGFGFNGIAQLGVYTQFDNLMNVPGLMTAVDMRLRYGFNVAGTDNDKAPPTGANAQEYVDSSLINNQLVSEGRSKGLSLMVNGMGAYQFSDLSWVYLNLGVGYAGGAAFNVGVGLRIGLLNN